MTNPYDLSTGDKGYPSLQNEQRTRMSTHLTADLLDQLNDEFNRQQFVHTFEAMADAVHQTAVEKGWWDDERVHGQRRNDGEIIALCHSELSECLEGLRHGNPPSEHIPEFTAVEEELADVIIRIMDFGKVRGHRVALAVMAKAAFNKTRPVKHGGKKF